MLALVILVVIGVGGGVSLSRLLFAQPQSSAPPPRTPFTFKWVDMSKGLKSGKSVGRLMYRAVRADHSSSMGGLTEAGNAPSTVMARVVFLSTRMLEASIHDASRTVTTTYYPPLSPGMVFRNKDNPENGCALVRIPTMSISHSDLMPISAERSDAGLSQCETLIGIRQHFCFC
jgi:hypothetical protein